MILQALHNGFVLAGVAAAGILGLYVVWQITKSLLKLLLWLVILGLLGTGILFLLQRAA